MTSIYEDDAVVADVTRRALEETGSRLLQIHRFSENEEEHARILLEAFNPRFNELIADVGCGVGHLAELMSQRRPDLKFTLINKSKSQLEQCPEGFRKLHGTASKMPLESCEVDSVMATYVLGHINLKKFIHESARVGALQIYVFDIFKEDDSKPCRLKSDLQYAEHTIENVVDTFEFEGFKAIHRKTTKFVPDKIVAMLPHPDSLTNTVSAAVVFKLHG